MFPITSTVYVQKNLTIFLHSLQYFFLTSLYFYDSINILNKKEKSDMQNEKKNDAKIIKFHANNKSNWTEEEQKILNNDTQESKGAETYTKTTEEDEIETEMNEAEFQRILSFLEDSYIGAHMMDDVILQARISRAVIAFCYDEFKDPNMTEEKFNEMWRPMMEQYAISEDTDTFAYENMDLEDDEE